MSNLNHRVIEAAIETSAQQSLPLGDAPADDASLRAAFVRYDLARMTKMTFEQFIADDLRRHCLANAIEERLRTRAGRA